jgi:hypothetical protein
MTFDEVVQSVGSGAESVASERSVRPGDGVGFRRPGLCRVHQFRTLAYLNNGEGREDLKARLTDRLRSLVSAR